MRRTLAIAVAAALAVTLGACRSAPTAPAEKPGITGEVTAISYGGDEESAVEGVLGTLLVEEASSEATGLGKANVTVTDATLVSRREEGKLAEASFEEIVEGDVAEVWFDGPVAESYPVQGRAKSVVIVK